MKKILFVSGRLGGGGAERVLTLIANQLLKKGYDASIIAFGEADEPYENKCPVTILRFKNLFDQLIKLRKSISKAAPDTIVAFEYHVGMKTIIAARGLHCRMVVSERSDPNTLNSQPLKRLLRNYLYGFADVVACQTDDARAYFPSPIRQKAHILCNPIKEGLPLWDYEQSQKTIVNFCRLEPPKNIPLLIEAFSIVHEKCPDYQLWLFGNGTEHDIIESIIKRKNLTQYIKLYPFCGNIHEIVRKCYMFVSSSDYEGVSNSMLEALAMGMPVVCTDCPIGGARMFIKSGHNGILVPPKDTGALASAMLELIGNPQKASNIASNAKKIYRQLSLEKITDKWIEIL